MAAFVGQILAMAVALFKSTPMEGCNFVRQLDRSCRGRLSSWPFGVVSQLAPLVFRNT